MDPDTGGTPETVAHRPAVGWVVDVQNDFMTPPDEGGRLYVQDPSDPDDPGARAARERIEAAVAWMREHCDALVFTGDWHSREDEEIDPESPDPEQGTYPPHCLGRSDDPEEREGARIIEAIRPEDPFVLDVDATREDARRAAEAAAAGRPVLIHKVRFDVFAGNPVTEAFLEDLATTLGGEPTFFVCGVARDVCVTQAIDGMRERGWDTVAIRDATWGLGLEPEDATLERWARGGTVVSLETLAGASTP